LYPPGRLRAAKQAGRRLQARADACRAGVNASAKRFARLLGL